MRKIINFNSKWAFTKNATEVPNEISEKWDFVNLPHTWNAIDGQDGGNDYYRGICYYAKELNRGMLPRADKYYLEFEGANSSAAVYANGKKIAHHDGGYSAWRVDITDSLTDKTLIAVAVDNSENEKVYPQMADFTFYGGIYRDVNIIAVSASHFELDYFGGSGIKVTPEIIGDNAKIDIEVFLTNPAEGQELEYVIKNKKGEREAYLKSSADETETSLYIENVHLWNGKKDPYLYTAEVYLLSEGKVIDNVGTRFGCRTFEINSEKGFILNGREYPLRGVSRHQDRWGAGNALLPEHHEEDMQLICELGATAIRLAHYQHDQFFYDLCDEKGIVVWAEIPYISKHIPNGRDNTVSQLKELITQNYNHPSIVVWGLSNEITMANANPDLIENHKALNELAHKMDKTRLTAIAVVSMCDIHNPYIQIPDAVSYNHYFGWYGGDVSMNGPWLDNFHREFPNIPIGISEYGCEALNWHTSNPTQGDYTEEYQAYYHEEMIKQLFSRKYLWASFVWNMFDFGADARGEGGENGQNHKGLVTFDRKYKKDAFYAYKAWLSDEPFVHICSKRYIERAEDITKVKIYSNLPEVELFANGKRIGRQKSENHFYCFDVPLSGEVRLLAAAGEYKDESLIKRVDAFNESYRLKEAGAVLNWFDITAPEGCFSLNDKVQDILSSDEGKKALTELFERLTSGDKENKFAGFEMNDAMMKMMGGFTVLRLTNLLGTADIKLSKDQLLSLNSRLNGIKKQNI